MHPNTHANTDPTTLIVEFCQLGNICMYAKQHMYKIAPYSMLAMAKD